MKFWKRIAAAALAVTMCLPATPMDGIAPAVVQMLGARAASTTASGTCGEDLTWTLDDEGTLTISGTGYMTYWDDVESVPWHAYADQIKRGVLEEGVGHISTRTFAECVNLTSVSIPSTVENIGGDAFYTCTSLEEITIPSTVNSIRFHAFHNCKSLKKVTILNKDCEIYDGATTFSEGDGGAFSGTIYGLAGSTAKKYAEKYSRTFKTLTVGSCGKNLTWTLDDEGTLTISGTGEMSTSWGNSTVVPWYPRQDRIKKINIENGVKNIGRSAFSDCPNLTTVTIPNGVTNIGESAFSNCPSLTSLNIPDGVTSIGYCAFYNCTALTSAIIPDSVTSIDGQAFRDCTELAAVSIPSTVTSIGGHAFCGTAWMKEQQKKGLFRHDGGLKLA